MNILKFSSQFSGENTCIAHFKALRGALFFLSVITLTLVLSIRPMPVAFYLAEFVLCSIIWGLVAFNYRLIDKALESKNKTGTLLSILLSAAFIPTHYHSLNFLILKFERENTGIPAHLEPYVSFFLSYKMAILIPIILFASISLCFIFIYLWGRLRKPVIDFFRNLERFEKVFLKAGGVIFAIITIVLFNLTNVFYLPSADADETVIPFDVVYTTATGVALTRDCYVNPAAPENDLRQPLFGIFAMPFGLLAKCISFVLPMANAYPVIMNIIQILLLLVSFILLGRMLEVSKVSGIYFLLIIVSAFPFMLFALNMEQYVFAFFWTILLVYNSYKTRSTGVLLPIAATGSIVTSATLILPLMFMNKESDIVKKCCKILVLFLAVFVCGGIINIIYKFNILITSYGGFMAPENGLTGKMQQFTHFIPSCFLAPPSQIINYGGHISYQLYANNSYNMAGIILLGFSVLSGFLFRRKYIAKISVGWVGFAFALIGLFGWGTAENGTILYSLYIFWAFIVLLMLLIDKFLTLTKTKSIFHIVYCLLFLALMIYNVKHMFDIINFGITHYPVL
jgi:hypothetical protein